MNGLVDALKEKGFPNVEQELKTCLLLVGSNTEFKLKNFNKKISKRLKKIGKKLQIAFITLQNY